MAGDPRTFRLIFSDDMARAIVSGRKDVTRRPLSRHPPAGTSVMRLCDCPVEKWGSVVGREYHAVVNGVAQWHVPPPCALGDILIGRECWRVFGGVSDVRVDYRAGGDSSIIGREVERVGGAVVHYLPDVSRLERPGGKWRPSIHMPDWAARIRRRVVSVTAERVQDITEEDAVREGIRRWTKDGSVYKFGHVEPGDIGCIPWVNMARTGREAFARLWDSIYAAKGLGWSVNPFVWRIEFASENERAG